MIHLLTKGVYDDYRVVALLSGDRDLEDDILTFIVEFGKDGRGDSQRQKFFEAFPALPGVRHLAYDDFLMEYLFQSGWKEVDYEEVHTDL